MTAPRFAAAHLIATAVAVLGAASGASALAGAECQRNARSIENSHEQHDDDLIRGPVRRSGDNCRVDLIATGEIPFNSGFTGEARETAFSRMVGPGD